MNGESLQKVDCTKFLGVLIDHGLTWKPHIDSISVKVAQCTGILSKLKHYLPRNILRSLYLTLILPHLSYCLPVWAGTSKKHLTKLTTLQKRAIRHICCVDSIEHTSKLFSSLNLLKFTDLIHIKEAVFAFRIVNNLAPPYFQQIFTFNCDTHGHNTRQSRYLRLPRFNSKFLKQSLRVRASSTWNTLPNEIQRCKSISCFKSKYFKHCIENY
ncbi:RNA-directed DNA polymerase from mobile element jockey [Holothuria leucospilota]|uniref:RNA-directed DNA polymerase from mobile element jockey n=1 Tax=Holothuria leucospilota TaxID=206669 RepID=A0A9Q0YLI5_HOLLE|nr:RNA-directed DNA polymerase from mobile element jockey [Holothuria leucospilota]